jgi:hypothetical protein
MNTQPKSAGHQPNVSDLRREIYELLSYFLSSRPVAELPQSRLYEATDPVHQFGGLERDLITARLISVAITVRILDDTQSAIFDLFTDYCGTITKNLLKPLENGGLGLRDACNKIIHARKVEFDFGTTESGLQYLNPYIYLEGTERKIPWVANLDIVKFCRESAAAVALLVK